ncbi:MAG: CHASE4 domain-containing protein [Candidatus Omnitrophota bacterium]
MKIQTKSFILFLLITTVFILGVSSYIVTEQKRLHMLFERESQEKEELFNKITELIGKDVYTFSYDYTWWDEMVDYVKAASDNLPEVGKTGYSLAEWAETNINITLDTFKCNAAWIFDTKLKLLHAGNNLEDESLNKLPVPLTEALSKLFPKEPGFENRFCHFFINIPEGIMEIRGATIHWGEDVERIKSPEGYFLVGRLWGKDFTDEIAKATGTKVSVSAKPEKMISVPRKGIIVFSRKLNGWDGKPLAYITVTAKSKIIGLYQKAFRVFLIQLVIFSLTILLIIAIYLFGFITAPLGMISKSLKEENITHADKLLADKTEFGDIMRLIKKFFEQRKSLVKEVDQRRKAEGEIKTHLRELEHFKSVTVGREMQMIELKKKINELSKELGKDEPYGEV